MWNIIKHLPIINIDLFFVTISERPQSINILKLLFFACQKSSVCTHSHIYSFCWELRVKPTQLDIIFTPFLLIFKIIVGLRNRVSACSRGWYWMHCITWVSCHVMSIVCHKSCQFMTALVSQVKGSNSTSPLFLFNFWECMSELYISPSLPGAWVIEIYQHIRVLFPSLFPFKESSYYVAQINAELIILHPQLPRAGITELCFHD